ncbi:MAG TPA: putative quinol monooxygenase, partial [Polyangiaceae bacterium]|nr:putative quinol monooxygenase [Polyangiaceae bacterium]
FTRHQRRASALRSHSGTSERPALSSHAMTAAAEPTDPTPTVAVLGTLRFPPDRVPEVLPHLQRLVANTYEKDGCIAYDVAIDPFDPGLIRFSELWPDQASLERHLVAPHIAPWRAAARACGLMARSFTAFEVSSARPV